MSRRLAFSISVFLVTFLAPQARGEDCETTKNNPCFPRNDFFHLNQKYDKLNSEIHALEKRKEDELLALDDSARHPQSLAKLDKWKKLHEGMETQEQELSVRLSDFAVEVVAAYRIPVDLASDAQIATGAYAGRGVRFAPKVILSNVYIETLKTPQGRTLTFSRDYTGSRAAGSTLPNGTVLLRPSAFGHGIGGLAAFIHHEAVHFKQWTTPGGITTTAESEKEAYAAILGHLKNDYQTYPEFATGMKANFEKYATEVDKAGQARLRWLIRKKPGDSTPFKSPLVSAIQTDDDWATLKRYSRDLQSKLGVFQEGRRKLDERLLVEREERGEYERRLAQELGEPWPPPSYSGGGNGCGIGIPGGLSSTLPCAPRLPKVEPRYPAPPPVAARPTEPAVAARLPEPAQPAFSTPHALNRLAAGGCGNPWAFTQEDLDWYWYRLSGTTFNEGSATRLGLEGCQYSLFMRLMQMASERNPERLTTNIFAQAAATARAPAYAQPFEEPYEPRTGSGPASPAVPTCRYHSWCRKWGE